jgi:hypothetical protein
MNAENPPNPKPAMNPWMRVHRIGAAGGGHNRPDGNVDRVVDRGIRQEGRQRKVGQFGEAHALNGEGGRKEKARLKPLPAACAADGIAERDRPGVLVRQDPVQ